MNIDLSNPLKTIYICNVSTSYVIRDISKFNPNNSHNKIIHWRGLIWKMCSDLGYDHSPWRIIIRPRGGAYLVPSI